MFHVLTVQRLAIFLQKNSVFIALVENILGESVTLSIKKYPVRYDQWHQLVNSNNFRFSEAPSVGLLLAQCRYW